MLGNRGISSLAVAIIVLALGAIAYILWRPIKKTPVDRAGQAVDIETRAKADTPANRCDRLSVYFAFDDASLTITTQKRLRAIARCMKRNPSATIQIQGHCDERGSRRYNFELGNRRASVVRRYLTKLGIDGERLTAISYGEDRPAVLGSNESAWANNRRAQFAELGDNS